MASVYQALYNFADNSSDIDLRRSFEISPKKLQLDPAFQTKLTSLYAKRTELMQLTKTECGIPWSGVYRDKIILELWPYKNNTLGFIMDIQGVIMTGPINYHTGVSLDVEVDFMEWPFGW